MMTFEEFQKIPPLTVIRVVSTRFQRVAPKYRGALTFVVKKGGGRHDWAIYCGPATGGPSEVEASGDKLTSEENILDIFPCDEETLKRYRR